MARPALARACALSIAAVAVGAVPAWAQGGDQLAQTSGDGVAESSGDGVAASSSEDTVTTGDATESTTTSGGRISIDADRTRVRLGQEVTFTGRREPARPGALVKLRYRRAGGDYRTVERTTTDAQGRYRVTAKPRRNGSFVVASPRESGKALRSGRVDVSVRAKLTIRARSHQLRSRGLRVRGRLRPRDGGRRVILQRQTGKGWDRVDATRTRSTGAYRFRWNPPSLGGYVLRTRFRGDELNRGDRAALDKRVNVYREDHASYYGPGFYGNTTACGQTLRRRTVGVAHKRIRCGRKVRFHYRGTTRRIPVIDRGPYVAGRRWDLTNAARKKLNFPKGTDEIWANR